jgi:hypothetical protein
MSNNRFDSFGELYRAAYAESDPVLKQTLLSAVKQALDRWAESEGDNPGNARKAPGPYAHPRREALVFHRVA